MKHLLTVITLLIMTVLSFIACRNAKQQAPEVTDDFQYFVDQFEDIRVLKYKLPAFESLSLQQKKYIYYLSEAALIGRDILWDQNFKYNLTIRKTIETIINTYSGDKETPEYEAFIIYAKRVYLFKLVLN